MRRGYPLGFEEGELAKVPALAHHLDQLPLPWVVRIVNLAVAHALDDDEDATAPRAHPDHFVARRRLNDFRASSDRRDQIGQKRLQAAKQMPSDDSDGDMQVASDDESDEDETARKYEAPKKKRARITISDSDDEDV